MSGHWPPHPGPSGSGGSGVSAHSASRQSRSRDERFPMDRARLIREMARLVGAEYVVSDPAELKVYETDGLTIFKATPDVVVLPESAAEVAEVVRLCVRERVPFVPRGAGTGLSGGALALEGGVVIGLNRMNRVLGGGLRQSAGGHRARSGEHLAHQSGQSRRLLLRAGPGQPDRLQRGRQRGRELGRAPLSQVRSHHQPRPRPGDSSSPRGRS